MSLSRVQLHHQSVVAQYHAGHSKPPTRKQAKSWLAPIRKALGEIKAGEVDAVRGYPITKMHNADEDYARIDYAINGFVAMIVRLMPDFDTSPMDSLAKKLANGILLEVGEIDACFALINDCEDRLITFSRQALKEAADTEMINIELERLGLKVEV